MAVNVHNTTFTAGPTSVGARTLLHTATADSTLLVWIHSNEATTYSAVAAGLNPLTRLGAISSGTSRSELWGLTAPPSGVLTISAIPAGTQVATWNLVATTFVGQRTTATPFGTVVAASATGTTAALSVSSTNADVVAFGFGVSANATVTLNTGTQLASVTHSTTGRLVVGQIEGASTVSLSASSSASGVWGMLAVPIITSASAANSVRFDNARATGSTGAVNSRGLLLTATAGAVLLVFVHTGAANSVSAVNVGAAQLTRLQADNYRFDFGEYRTELWGLTAPASGTLTISAALAGAAAAAGGLAAMTFVGQRTDATPFGGIVAGSATVTAAASLIISTTANDRVAVFFGLDEPAVQMNPEGGVVTRTAFTAAAAGSPIFILADSPGKSNNVTATAFLAAGSSLWGYIGINIIASSGAANTSAIGAMTDAPDVLAAVGDIVIRGTFSATDAADRFTATARTIIRGTINATDLVDTLSSAAKVRITARLSATEAFADTFAATAFTRVTARLSATDAADTFAASGRLIIRGTLAATDAPDVFAANAAVRISATFAATDAPDIFVASAYIAGSAINGTFAATDAPDTFAATAKVRISAFLNATDTTDTLASTAKVIVRGLLAATDTPDVFAATGLVLGSYRTAALAATDVPDSFSAPAYVVVRGLAAFTDAPDTFAALVNNISASAAVVTTLQDLGSGGGGSKRKKPPYIRAPEDFWAIRERHLKSIHEEMVESAEPASLISVTDSSPVNVSPQLISYRLERTSVIQKIQQAEDRPKLYNRTKRLKQLNANIAEQKRQQQLLAQKLAEQKRLEKKRRNLARARKLKKAVKLLAIARALSTLTYLYGKL